MTILELLLAIVTFICAIALTGIDKKDEALALILLSIGTLSAMAAIVLEFIR